MPKTFYQIRNNEKHAIKSKKIEKQLIKEIKVESRK